MVAVFLQPRSGLAGCSEGLYHEERQNAKGMFRPEHRVCFSVLVHGVICGFCFQPLWTLSRALDPSLFLIRLTRTYRELSVVINLCQNFLYVSASS